MISREKRCNRFSIHLVALSANCPINFLLNTFLISFFFFEFHYCLQYLFVYIFCALTAGNGKNTIKFMMFSFYQKNVHFIKKKMQFCACFLKMFCPLKVACFLLNNLHFPMVEGIAFYALYKSGLL